MKNSFRLDFSHIVSFLVVFLTFVFLVSAETSTPHVNTDGHYYEIEYATVSVDGKDTIMKFPSSISDLDPSTKLTVSFYVNPAPGENLYLETSYAITRVYADDELLYAYGEDGTYPEYMKDPPFTVFSVALPNRADSRPMRLHIEYVSPEVRNSLTMHRMLVGTAAGINTYLVHQHLTQLILAIIILASGIIMIFMSQFFHSLEGKGRLLLWPGILCLSAGLWEFNENELALYLFQKPALMYILDYVGFISVLIPLNRITATALHEENSLFLKILVRIQEIVLLGLLLLQLSGYGQFYANVYYVHVLQILQLLMLTIYSIWVWLRKKKKSAFYYTCLIMIVFAASVMEVLSYYLHPGNAITTYFQIGITIYVVGAGITSIISVVHVYQEQKKAVLLENELELIKNSLEAQAKKNEMLMQHYEEVKRQRHDMRHHFAAIREGIEKKKYDKVIEYMDSVVEAIPVDRTVTYCDNPASNAILSYYASLCAEKNIPFTVDTEIPLQCSNVPDAELIVVIGNLLENAIEASELIEEERRKIRFASRVQGETLFITCVNAYDAQNVRKIRGRFVSTKRNALGTGTRSVLSVAEKHHGNARYTPEDKVFRAEVYFQI